MSKKDKIEKQKKLIQELCLLNINLAIMVSLGKEKPTEFEQGSIPSSKPDAGKVEQGSPTRDGAIHNKTKCAGFCEGEEVLPKFCTLRGGIKCNNTRLPDPNLGEKKQEKTDQPQQSEAEKEQELAAEKRTEYINLALKKLVDDLTRHHNFILNDYSRDRAKQVEMLQIYCDNFKDDLADFRRKVLSVSELVEAKQATPKQDETTPPELEQGKVKKAETAQTEAANPTVKKDDWFYAIWADIGAGKPRLYAKDFKVVPDRGDCRVRILTTQNKAEAAQYDNIETARKMIDILKLNGVDTVDTFETCELRVVLVIKGENEAEQVEKGAEQVETEQPEGWAILKKQPKSMVLLIVDGRPAHYATEQDAENAIINAIWDGELSGEIGDYKAVLYSDYFDKSGQLKAEQSEPILPAPEQKEADESGSGLGGTWLIYDKIDKAWAAKCSDGGFYWSSKQDDFVLKFTSEAEARQRYDALCSRGLISVMHRANSGVIRKEQAEQSGSELGGTDGADSPKKQIWVIETNQDFVKSTLPCYVQSYTKTSGSYTNLAGSAAQYNSQEQTQKAINEMVELGRGGTNYFIPTQIE